MSANFWVVPFVFGPFLVLVVMMLFSGKPKS